MEIWEEGWAKHGTESQIIILSAICILFNCLNYSNIYIFAPSNSTSFHLRNFLNAYRLSLLALGMWAECILIFS